MWNESGDRVLTGSGVSLEVMQRGMRILRADGDTLYASQGFTVFQSEDGGRSWEPDGEVPAPSWRRALEVWPLAARAARNGVFDLVVLPDGARLALASGVVARAEAGSPDYAPVFRIQRGSRPLNLCLAPDDRVYWGEYFLNLRRSSPVRIFGSPDGGRTWEAVYAFEAGRICHVHRVVADVHDGSILVCTGDRDEESVIWRTRDGFDSLELVAGGSQDFRTACPVPRRECILYGTDNPAGTNFIAALRRDGRMERIQDVPGPVMHGCRVGEKVAFSTMIEEDHHRASVWLGDEKGFREVLRLPGGRGGRWWREVVGYSTIVLPEGAGTHGDVLCTPLGTSGHAGEVLALKMENGER